MILKLIMLILSLFGPKNEAEKSQMMATLSSIGTSNVQP